MRVAEAKSREKKCGCFIAAIICPIIMTSIGLFLRNMLPGQKNVLIYGDYICEYLPFFRHFWDALFHGKSLEYSFSLGMGSSTAAMYSIFAFSPFSIIPYIIKNVTIAGYVTWMLKMAFASGALYFFLMHDLRSRRGTALIFSLFYSMSSYVLIYYINIHFMDVFYLLPFLMHFLISFIKEEKCVGLVVFYTLCFINNFFEGFCVGIFSFIIYLLLLWYMEFSGEKLIKNFAKYCVIVLIAVLLSMPVILPAIMFVVLHMASGSDFSTIPLQSPTFILNSLLFGRRIYNMFDSMPAIYCGWPSVLLTSIFFIDKNDKKKKVFAAVPLLLLIICSFWHPAYLFMHLFNEPDTFPWRFSFLIIFLFVCIAAYEYDHMEKKLLNIRYIIPSVIILGAIAAAYFLYSEEFIYYDIIPIGIFAINMGFLLFHILGAGKAYILYFVGILEMLCAVTLQIPQTQSFGQTQQDVVTESARLETMTESIKKDDSDFFRTSIFAPRQLNSSLFYDYHGMEFFCSFDNNALNNALVCLGLRARPQQYNNIGNTEFTNMLFSVKYSGSIYDDKQYSNSPVLPLAFSVSEDVKFTEITEDPFENQQRLANDMIIGEKSLYSPIQLNMEKGAGIVLEKNSEGGGCLFRKTGDDATVTWYTDENEVKPAYMYIDTGVRSAGMFDLDKIVSGDPITTATALSLPCIYKLYKKDDNTPLSVYLRMEGETGSEVTVEKTIARRLDTDSLQNIYDELSPLGIKIDSFRDDRIHGTVTADEDHSVLFSSIPFDINWQIKIDGKECDTYAVFNGAFLACDITPGTHEVEYIYKDRSVTMGIGAFAIGLLLFMLLLKNKNDAIQGAEEKKDQNKEKAETKEKQSCASQ